MEKTRYYQRAFFAIPLANEITAATAGIYHQLHHESGYEELHWVKPSLQHITLHFLGGVAGETLLALVEELTPKLLSLPTFSLTLGSLRLFPNLRKAHCLILRVSLPDELQIVVDCLLQAIAHCHIESESKPFRPHITLARIPAQVRRLKRPVLECPELVLPVQRIVLLNSQQGPQGVVYDEIAQFSLDVVQSKLRKTPTLVGNV